LACAESRLFTPTSPETPEGITASIDDQLMPEIVKTTDAVLAGDMLRVVHRGCGRSRASRPSESRRFSGGA